ncbi:MAG: glucose-6-phosphate isomerase [Smithellaceae bacterium]|nr:glucose-6-phosphate isomerase [Smithellaceae bacterium]
MKLALWERYKKYLWESSELGLRLDISRMNFPDGYLEEMTPRMKTAFQEMASLEAGALANPDENRMVGHYWLRSPELAPKAEIRGEIESAVAAIKDFTDHVHAGRIISPGGKTFSRLLIIGIGGSALGPQLMAQALGTAGDPMKAFFLDNTDPDGMDLVLQEIGEHLGETVAIVISKSGRTIETRNGMIEAKMAYLSRGIPFERCAVAITEPGSLLDELAQTEGWLARFPLWDWVGGRTSVTSPVGLLPAALQGFDIESFLAGARRCDEFTRLHDVISNPAALLALMWHHATGGCGKKDMVVIPYKDRLLLLPRYLQQLVMESLGKRLGKDGRTVNQGISVFGNKGSTDQHSYVQQLRDGVDNFFVTFIEVLQDRVLESIPVAPGVTSGDYLQGFFLGTREALTEGGRESLTITIDKLDARALGALIALYERAVGLYASLVNINAYHQPGVEAGKKAAGEVIRLQGQVAYLLREEKGKYFTPAEIAAALGEPQAVELIFKILEHAAANIDHHIEKIPGAPSFETRYGYM